MTTGVSPNRRSEILLDNIGKTDCGVIAIQGVTGIRREQAEEVALAFGWGDKGMWMTNLNAAIRSLGYSVIARAVESGETVATFALSKERGVYLVYTKDHVMPLVEGDLFNCSVASHDLVEAIYEVLGPEVAPS